MDALPDQPPSDPTGAEAGRPTTITDLAQDRRPDAFLASVSVRPITRGLGRLRAGSETKAQAATQTGTQPGLPSWQSLTPNIAPKEPVTPFGLVRLVDLTPATYRTLYRFVGDPWDWVDRVRMPDESLAAILADPGTEVFAFTDGNTVAGYGELAQTTATEIELRYFGFGPSFVGRRWGRPALAAMLEQAWRPGIERVTVETCTLDHPRALSLYQEAGFVTTGTRTRVIVPLSAAER